MGVAPDAAMVTRFAPLHRPPAQAARAISKEVRVSGNGGGIGVAERVTPRLFTEGAAVACAAGVGDGAPDGCEQPIASTATKIQSQRVRMFFSIRMPKR
jgi:hypothetical protein